MEILDIYIGLDGFLYIVSAFDLAEAGIEKARDLAERNHVEVDFFTANMNDYKSDIKYDIIYSSGVLHYLSLDKRASFFHTLKKNTMPNGIHVLNVFVKKPFIDMPPDSEEAEKQVEPWYSGEIANYYHDWFFHKSEEIIFDCNSGNIPHQHCMDILIAENKTKV